MKKILIIHTSSGYGHLKIAENIAAVLRQGNDVELLNLFKAQKGIITEWGQAGYLWVLRNIPWLWDFFYTNKTFIRLSLPYRVKVASKNAENVTEILEKGQYDYVISTQVSASSVLSYIKSTVGFSGKFVVTFSDFHLHPYWLFDNVDLYLANIASQKEEMIVLGIPENKIAVTGITVPPLENLDLEAIRRKYSVDPNQKVILVLGGGRGLGLDYETVSKTLGLGAKVIVVCGKNLKVKDELEKELLGTEALVLGYVENMSELYAIANIVVTKPGGLTVTECLQRRLPMYISSYLPGQEKYNYDYLEEKGLVMEEGMTLRGTLEDELATGNFKKDLEKNPLVDEIAQTGQKILDLI